MESYKLTQAAIKSVTHLSQYLASKYSISYLGGHQEVFCNHTVCPGNQMMNEIHEINEQSCTNPADCVITEQN